MLYPIVLSIDPPPSSNQAYKPVVYMVNGQLRHRVALTPEAQAWKQTAFLRLRERRANVPWLPEEKKHWSRSRYRSMRLELYTIWLLPPALFKGRRDLDGYHKFVQDAVSQAWEFDDSRIDTYFAKRLLLDTETPPALVLLCRPEVAEPLDLRWLLLLAKEAVPLIPEFAAEFS